MIVCASLKAVGLVSANTEIQRQESKTDNTYCLSYFKIKSPPLPITNTYTPYISRPAELYANILSRRHLGLPSSDMHTFRQRILRQGRPNGERQGQQWGTKVWAEWGRRRKATGKALAGAARGWFKQNRVGQGCIAGAARTSPLCHPTLSFQVGAPHPQVEVRLEG